MPEPEPVSEAHDPVDPLVVVVSSSKTSDLFLIIFVPGLLLLWLSLLDRLFCLGAWGTGWLALPKALLASLPLPDASPACLDVVATAWSLT